MQAWNRGGLLEREVEIYRRLAATLGGVGFLTYGRSDEPEYARTLDGIDLHYNRWNLPKRVYRRLVPLIHAAVLPRYDVFKTNQTSGSEVAVWAKRLFGKKLIARCGYMLSLNRLDRDGGKETEAVRLARHWESQAFHAADRVEVTTASMKSYVVKQYGVDDSKVWVIPNYVLTDVFKPEPGRVENKRRICFIGRLEPMKDPALLLEASKGLDVELDIIGDGPLRPFLETRADQLGMVARFRRIVPHASLPGYLNSSAVFVATSRHENHPKALLEAMACGVPVIGVNVRGISEVIEHGVTGYLCERSPEGVRQAISTVLGDDVLRESLGRNGREFVVQDLSIQRIIERELELLDSLF